MRYPNEKVTGIAHILFIIFSLAFIFSCAGTFQKTREGHESSDFISVSEGLPHEGLWRQNLAVTDMNGDGFPDIVAPPPRKAEKGENKPEVFLWDQTTGKWKSGEYTFPEIKEYGYGSIAAGDINRDGYPDIVLAVHTGKINVFYSNRERGFVRETFPSGGFKSRAVVLADVNSDGWPDIIALSELLPPKKNKESEEQNGGILLGINKAGQGWDVSIIAGSEVCSGDSLAAGDIDGDGNKDIVVATLTSINEFKKLVWFGDGKGNFKKYDADIVGDMIPFTVRTGDIDGDGKDEIIFNLSGVGEDARSVLAVLSWTGKGFEDKSLQLLDLKYVPLAFDLADIDGDGKDELVAAMPDGVSVFRFTGSGWVNAGLYPVSKNDITGVYDIEAVRNNDGSVLFVYNLGMEGTGANKGIRAYRLK